MKKKRNLLGIIYWIILIAGSILLAGYCVWQSLSGSLIARYVGIWAMLLLLGAILVFFLPYGRSAKKMDALMPILTKERNPQRYIQELSSFLEQTSSGMLFQVGLLNLAAARCQMREHKKAQDLLKQVQPGTLSLANKSVYWSTYALTCFYLGEKEEGCRIIDKHGHAFMNNQKLNRLGPVPSILMVFYYLQKNQKKEARELYAKSRKKWYSSSHRADFDYLEKQF